jgi:hypothetical protein
VRRAVLTISRSGPKGSAVRTTRGESGGVRFRLFPQPPVLPAFAEPETISVSRAPGSIGPGPSDERMYVADALQKSQPYEYPYLPPYAGAVHSPVLPGPDGHFDHIPLDTREFNAAHMYGTLRFVLDIWEDYFGGRIDWHFSEHYSRLELIPHLDWDNAQSGYGFIETGFGFDEDYGEHPFCLNFDILSHELGHSFVFSVVGAPRADRVSAEYLGFQEAASDIVTLISTLHFRSVVGHVLAETRGNIFVPNELNRFAELSPTRQIRDAGNSLRLDDVPDIRTPVALLSQPDRHLIGQPLTGAVFDILVELFQGLLVERGLIGAGLDAISRRVEQGMDEENERVVQQRFDEAFEGNDEAFAAALIEARDIVGALCAAAFRQLRTDLTYAQVAEAFLCADRLVTGGRLRGLIRECFDWRQIAPLPQRMPNRIVQFRRRGGIVTRKSM